MAAEVLTHDGESGPESLREQADRLLAHLGLQEAELSVLLCSDEVIAGLNETWRGKAEPTDVLSFPQGDSPDGAPRMLGDVVISTETAARQAHDLGHQPAEETSVLLVHGLLHLLGHRHQDDEERAVMVAQEHELLAVLGLKASGLIARA